MTVFSCIFVLSKFPKLNSLIKNKSQKDPIIPIKTLPTGLFSELTNTSEDIVRRITNYLNELEQQKEATGEITTEFVADAARLIAQANSSLKLVGQLKKEIGVDSQLLLAQAHMNNMSHILIDVLRDTPELLDQVELRMAALREPTSVQDVDFEVIE